MHIHIGRTLEKRLKRPRRDTAAAHWVEAVYLWLVTALFVAGWIALILAELGYFSIGLLGLLASLVIGGIVLATRRAPELGSLDGSWDVAGLVPPLLLAVALFTPPFEFIIGGVDPGVYVNTAVQIARTGSIVITDVGLQQSTPFREYITTFGGDQRLPGFYVSDPSRGSLVPHGLHLYPSVLAIGYGLFGIWGSLWLTSALALLGLVGFYLLVRRLFGSVVAAIAAVLLVVNPAVIWFARYPAAENLVQVWMFAGLFALVLAHDTGSRRLAVLAGFMLGAVHLTKIEEVMLPVVLCGFLVYQWLTHRWRTIYWYMLPAYAIVVVHAALHAHFIATAYVYGHLEQIILSKVTPERLTLAAAGVLLGVAAFLIGRWLVRRLTDARLSEAVAIAVAVVAPALAGFAYYLRPKLYGPPTELALNSPADLYFWATNASYVILGWYVSPLALVLAPIGFSVATIRNRSTRTAVLLALAFADAVWLLYEARISPRHFWAARRYLPVVFPTFALFSAYLLWRLQLALRNRWPEGLVPAALGAIIVLSCLGGWLPFRHHIEYRGVIEQSRALAAQIPAQGILLFDDSSLASYFLSTPLQYLWDRQSVILWGRTDADQAVSELLDDWVGHGQDVYWVRTGAPPDVERWGFGATLVATQSIDLPFVLETTDRRPDTVGRLQHDLQIYRILPKP